MSQPLRRRYARTVSVTERHSESLEWQLTAPLFSQKFALIVGSSAMALVGSVSWAQCRQSWLLVWAAANLVVLAGRLLLARSFERHATPLDLPAWNARFTIGVWTLGCVWGCAAFAVVTGADPLIQMILLSTQCVAVMGGAARNYGNLVAGVGQVLFGVVPAIVACLWAGTPLYLTFALLLALEVVASLTMMRELRAKTVRALTLDQEKVALVTRLQSATTELVAVNRQLEGVAHSDALTGIANRRSFDLAFAQECQRDARNPTRCALLMLDIDHFKRYNDHYGHVTGDACLRRVALALAAAALRPSDLVARYGGEEFVVLLPGIDGAGALAVAERMRAAVEELAVAQAGSEGCVVTVSIGAAAHAAGAPRAMSQLLVDADTALYAAKTAGRNCVRYAQAASEGAEFVAYELPALP